MARQVITAADRAGGGSNMFERSGAEKALKPREKRVWAAKSGPKRVAR